MKRFFCGSIIAACGVISPLALGALTKANFNDIATGQLSGKSGGSGFASSWTGSSTLSVIAGDLSSSLYWLNQPGTPQSVRGNNNAELRQDFRVVSSPFSGEVWFSFLQLNAGTSDRSGMSFNPPTASPFNNPGSAFLYFSDTSIVYRFGEASDQTVASPVTVGNTGLVVGQFIINGSGGADGVKIWVDPVLGPEPTRASILAITPTISNNTLHFADTVTVLGAIAWRSTTGSAGGVVDNLAVSDGGGNGEQAFSDVVPEPGAVSMLALGVLGVLRRRR